MDMTGRTCLITGGNAGIGKATALRLARMGATVVLACRNGERGEPARAEIIRESGNDRVGLLVADLAVQRDIREMVSAFRRRYDRLHLLINNAGLFVARRTSTPDGFETTFAVNHLAPFLLTNLLLEELKAAAPARIVTVTSDAHRRAAMDFDNLGGDRRYSWLDAYAQSKLANILFTYELARRLEGTGVTATCVHPGVVATQIWNRNRTPFHYFLRLFKMFYVRPAWSARAVVHVATAPDLEGATGQYFDKKKQTRSSRASYAEGVARRLWDLSARYTHLTERSSPV